MKKPPYGGKRQRILMIDDDAKLRRLVSDFLSLFGFSVAGAEDGLEGLEKIKKRRF